MANSKERHRLAGDERRLVALLHGYTGWDRDVLRGHRVIFFIPAEAVQQRQSMTVIMIYRYLILLTLLILRLAIASCITTDGSMPSAVKTKAFFTPALTAVQRFMRWRTQVQVRPEGKTLAMQPSEVSMDLRLGPRSRQEHSGVLYLTHVLPPDTLLSLGSRCNGSMAATGDESAFLPPPS